MNNIIQNMAENNEGSIIELLNKILLLASTEEASDIHFEPYETHYRIRFRIDGLLIENRKVPNVIGLKISARLKVLASLDIAEKRIPQDGRFKINLSENNQIDFRISTCPTINGEKIVVRLINSFTQQLDINKLGLTTYQKSIFIQSIHKPQGMILVTGPTGSGKTTTLYTALDILNTIEKNISTAEDPVELKIEGINQVQMNSKTGLNFSNTLRAFLRQDPDIIMVGEIRDIETAEIAIKAAQTGHLVLSTLHTNSAVETVTRLINMGIAHFNLANSINLIIAQRLARKLCDHCKQMIKLPKDTLIKSGFHESIIDNLTLYEANHCENCHNGYKGRTAFYEMLVVSKKISTLMLENRSASAILEAAILEGFKPMQQSACNQVATGITSLSEMKSILKNEI